MTMVAKHFADIMLSEIRDAQGDKYQMIIFTI